MTLMNCETCNGQIAKKAKTCPHCGVKRSTRGFFKTTLIVFIVFMLLAMIGASGDSSLPTCDSQTGIAAAKDELNMRILQASMRSQYVAGFNIEIIDIENAKEVSYNEEQKTRSCTGMAVSNQGNNGLNYSFKILNDGELHVEAKLIQ